MRLLSWRGRHYLELLKTLGLERIGRDGSDVSFVFDGPNLANGDSDKGFR
jgi:hypothetical protein